MTAVDIGVSFARRPSFRAAAFAAGADRWRWWQVRLHMAHQVDNLTLKIFYLVFGAWSATGVISSTVAGAVLVSWAVWLLAGAVFPLWPTFVPVALGVVCFWVTAFVILVYFGVVFFNNDQWLTGDVRMGGTYKRLVGGRYDNDYPMPASAFKILEDVRETYPDAIGTVSYIGFDPILRIYRSHWSIASIVAKIWDEDDHNRTVFLKPGR